MKYYITKYALTEGILEVSDATHHVYSREGYLYYNTDGPHRVPTQVAPTDWFESRDHAVQRAESLRDRKVQSIQKQLQRLQNLKF